MTRAVSLAAVLLVLAVAAFAQTPQKIDVSKSWIRFVSKQMNVPVEGKFNRFQGTATFDPKKPEATRAEIEVELGSIDLGNPEGETEVRRKLWFDVDGFPKARFVSKSVKATGPGKYEASGTLSIKGVSRDIVAPFALTEAAGVRTVDGQFAIKRLWFRIGEAQWSDTETVADDVLVRFHFTFPNP